MAGEDLYYMVKIFIHSEFFFMPNLGRVDNVTYIFVLIDCDCKTSIYCVLQFLEMCVPSNSVLDVQ